MLLIVPQILNEFRGKYPLLEPQLNIITKRGVVHDSEVGLLPIVSGIANYYETTYRLELHRVEINNSEVIGEIFDKSVT